MAERQDDIRHAQPGVTRSKFVYFVSHSSYERDWGKQYDRPTLRDQVAAQILKLIPPVGPLRALRFKMPTAEVEKLFTQSFDRSVVEYSAQLDRVRAGTLTIENSNYDLGKVVKPGVYALQDDTYAYWLDLLASKQYETVTPDMRRDLLDYFGTIKLSRAAIGLEAKIPIESELQRLKDLNGHEGLLAQNQ